MLTEIETDDGRPISIDAYCPTCGADAVPPFGRNCDCSLRDDVVCSVVVYHPDVEEPIRKTLTDRHGLLDRQTLLSAFRSALEPAEPAE